MKVLDRIAVLIICTVIVLSLAGCGTLFGNKHPEVGIDSDPDGAKVYINGDFMGNTPVKIQLQNDKEYRIEFKKDGYQSKIYTLGKHVAGVWIVLDILAGVIPIVVDVATGGWYELDSAHVQVLLEKS